MGQPSRDEIIVALYQSKEINETLSKVKPSHLRDDLRQEVFVVLCDLPPERLVAIYNSKNTQGLRYYAVGLIWRTIKSKRPDNDFVKKFRQQFFTDLSLSDEDSSFIERLADIPDVPEEGDKGRLDMMVEAFETLSDYKRKLIEVYVDMGCSSKRVSEFTEIPERTIRNTIAKAREAVLKQVKLSKK